MSNTVAGIHLGPDTHANRPAASAVTAGTLYSCSDHDLVYISDGASWSTWATLGGGGAGASPVYDIERRTAGDLSITSTTAGAAVPSLSAVTVAAAAGDLLMIGLDTRLNGSPGNVSMRVDVASIVAAAAANYVSSLGASPASTGISAWFGFANEANQNFSGEVPYVVQAGDIEAGEVDMSLRAWLSAAGTFTLTAQAAAPLNFWVRNLGQ